MLKSIVAYFGDKLNGRRSPPLQEIASARGSLAASLGSIAPYNPDDLIGKRGYAIYDAMQRDAHVQACLTIKKLAVLSRGWQAKSVGTAGAFLSRDGRVAAAGW